MGLTATDSNIRYTDINIGIFKTSHHAVIDETWYLQVSRPPPSQLQYDLGLMNEDDFDPFEVPDIMPHATCPPFPSTHPEPTAIINNAIWLLIPSYIVAQPPSVVARLARISRKRWVSAIVMELESLFMLWLHVARTSHIQWYAVHNIAQNLTKSTAMLFIIC